MNDCYLKKIVLVGAGNLATRLGIELQKRGCEIMQVYSRTGQSAQMLADILHVPYTTDLSGLKEHADLYIFSLKDNVLPEVISKVRYTGGVWVHTAGSVDIEVFNGYTPRYGVFYPLQSFSKSRAFDFSKVAIFTEANSETDASALIQLGSLLSSRVVPMSSEKRRYLHLSAVFACNFTNHLYTIAFKLLEEHGIDGTVLLPLTEETEAKIHEMHPYDAQTGPAVRFDTNVIAKHLELLNDPDLQSVYELISNHIHKTHTK